MSNNIYNDLMNAEHGSQDHLDIVAEIKAREIAAMKADENKIHGTGRSGHASAQYTIDPGNAVPSNVDTYLGAMSVGVSSGNIDPDTINVGGMVTSRAVAESMRRTYSAADWKELTGLEYVNLLTDPVTQEPNQYFKKVSTPTQEALDAANAAERAEKDKLDAEREAREQEAGNYGKSVLEEAVANAYSPDMAEAAVKDVVATGELNAEAFAAIGADQGMLDEAVEHYRAAADGVLEQIGSCSTYLEDALSDDEQRAARAAIVSKDTNTLLQLGAVARDRFASMSFDQVRDYLTKSEAKQLKLSYENRQVVVTLPGVGKTSWASAVSNGWLTFA